MPSISSDSSDKSEAVADKLLDLSLSTSCLSDLLASMSWDTFSETCSEEVFSWRASESKLS